MPRVRLRSFALPLLALAGSLAFTPAVHPLGPPWISIEYPPSPYDRTTRDAYLLVHAFHHGTPADFPPHGTAEGIVGGQRRSVTLAFTHATREGTYALTKQWPDGGTWTLLITVNQGPDDGVSAVVDIGAAGQVVAVNVPTEQRSWGVAPKQIAVTDLEPGLKARALLASAPAPARP
jgi:hypothetical protein